MALHEEVSCALYEEELARRQVEVFREDLESCREFTLDDWHAQSAPRRARNSFLRLFSRLL